VPPYQFERLDTGSYGYFMCAPFSILPGAAYRPAQMIIDSQNGHLVYYKLRPAIAGLGPLLDSYFDFRLLNNGKLAYAEFSVKPSGDVDPYYIVLDSTLAIADTVRTVGYTTDPHDLQALPNGNYLMLGFVYDTLDLTGYTVANGQPGGPDTEVEGTIVQEITPQGQVIWAWNSFDHIAIDEMYPELLTNLLGAVDYTHANSVEVDVLDGNIIVSFRTTSSILKINRQTGQVMWRLGGKFNDFSYVNDSGFSAQHDARRLPNGWLTLYDNGLYNPTPGSRPLAYQLDETQMTATKAWDFTPPQPLTAQGFGNAQFLNNGHMVVGWGSQPLPPPTLSYINTATNQMVTNVFLPANFVSYRAEAFKLPWRLPQPDVTCSLNGSGDTLYLQAPDGHASYWWSTGQTSRSIAVADTGWYYVYVPTPNQGFVSSVPLYVSDRLNVPCQPAGIDAADNQLAISLWPNPSNGAFTVQHSAAQGHALRFTVTNALGQVAAFEAQPGGAMQTQIRIANPAAGLYYLTAEDPTTGARSATSFVVY